MSNANADGGNGPDALRASDDERRLVVQQLNDAADEGRLTLAEFSERAAAAYAATTRADLAPLVADLPADRPTADRSPAARSAAGVTRASGAPTQRVPVGAIKRGGRWQLDRETRLGVTLGAIKLDLAGAQLAGPEADLYVRTGCGSVKVWVPVGIRVVVDGHTTFGTRTIEEDSAPGPGPLVRLHVDTWAGSVKVYRV